MVKHDKKHVGSPDADTLPADLVELLEQERRYLDQLDQEPLQLDLELFQQELFKRAEADTIRRFARNQVVIRILSAVSTIEAAVIAALLVVSPPRIQESAGPDAPAIVEEHQIDPESPEAVKPPMPAPDFRELRPPGGGEPPSATPPIDPTHPPPAVPPHAIPPHAAPTPNKPPPSRKELRQSTEDPSLALTPPTARQGTNTLLDDTDDIISTCSKCRATTAWDTHPSSTCSRCSPATDEGFDELVNARR